jgi:hypothetical protein
MALIVGTCACAAASCTARAPLDYRNRARIIAAAAMTATGPDIYEMNRAEGPLCSPRVLNATYSSPTKWVFSLIFSSAAMKPGRLSTVSAPLTAGVAEAGDNRAAGAAGVSLDGLALGGHAVFVFADIGRRPGSCVIDGRLRRLSLSDMNLSHFCTEFLGINDRCRRTVSGKVDVAVQNLSADAGSFFSLTHGSFGPCYGFRGGLPRGPHVAQQILLSYGMLHYRYALRWAWHDQRCGRKQSPPASGSPNFHGRPPLFW